MTDKVSEKMAKRIKNAGQWLIENADLIANKSKLCTKCYISFEVMRTDIIPSIDIDYSFVVPEDDKSKGTFTLKQVFKFEDTDRGDNGFGSSGR